MSVQPVTSQTFKDARIHYMRVVDVNIANYSVSVVSDFGKLKFIDIPFATPYQHSANGEGIYFMPEVGSVCWVCDPPSDGGKPFVLAWASAQNEADFRAYKMELNPGDIYLGTRDENCLILRRGGIVQIGSTGVCQRLFLPVNNTIKDFCENYSLNTVGGDLEWTVQRSENDSDGKRPSTLRIAARQFANDEKPLAELEIGSHGEKDDTILSLIIKESGEPSAAPKFTLKIDKSGNVSWVVKKNVSWDVTGEFKVEAKENVLIKTAKNATLHADQDLTIEGSSATMEAKTGTATVKSPSLVKLDSPMTQAGGTQPVAMASPLLIWLATHIHPSAAGPTGVPTPPPPTDIISKSLYAK